MSTKCPTDRHNDNTTNIIRYEITAFSLITYLSKVVNFHNTLKKIQEFSLSLIYNNRLLNVLINEHLKKTRILNSSISL